MVGSLMWTRAHAVLRRRVEFEELANPASSPAVCETTDATWSRSGEQHGQFKIRNYRVCP